MEHFPAGSGISRSALKPKRPNSTGALAGTVLVMSNSQDGVSALRAEGCLAVESGAAGIWGGSLALEQSPPVWLLLE